MTGGTPGAIYDHQRDSRVDETRRKVRCAALSTPLTAQIEARIAALGPDLARHFNVPLDAHEDVQYLAYEPGGFYRPHRDRQRDGDASGDHQRRRVSIVVFLGRPDGVEPGDYAGGELQFFDLIDAPEWRGLGIACDAEPGLLIAFPADTLHAVAPVTRGYRCAIAAWFR